MTGRFYLGVEGGGTCSKAALVNQAGVILCSAEGPGTNHWQIGFPECARRILSLADAVLKGVDITFAAVGLGLSGISNSKNAADLVLELRKQRPSWTCPIHVVNDCVGALSAASSNGGVVVIAGTGSNCCISNYDGSHSLFCGGHGHMLGDEGSAFWIAQRCVKACYDHLDGLSISEPVDKCYRLICKYFELDEPTDIYKFLYSNFDKSKMAGLCKLLAELATADNDALAVRIFADAGRCLARFVVTVTARYHELGKINEICNNDASITVLCVGGVWNSFPLLKDSFRMEILSGFVGKGFRSVNLLSLKTTCASGCAWMGSMKIGTPLSFDHKENAVVLDVIVLHH